MLRAKIGTVQSTADITTTGEFWVAFKVSDGNFSRSEPVRYVSPMGNANQAFIAIPPEGSQVLCLYEDDVAAEGEMMNGYYYVGSVMGNIPGLNNALPATQSTTAPEVSNEYLPKEDPGLHGVAIPQGKSAKIQYVDSNNLNYMWPQEFRDMYFGKDIVPEKMGLTNSRGDSFIISSRYSSNKSLVPFQDSRVSMHSGSGKKFELVDSGIVDGIVMETEHKGKDYFIWSSKSSPESPFSEGEYHMRTHGPVNMYTLHSNYSMWVEDGFNFNIENRSTPRLSYPKGEGINGFTGTESYWGIPLGEGGYKETRAGQFGNETTGCIKLMSRHNNISLSALEVDSVIHIHAPGVLSKVIIDTGGSVDIVAQGKITLQSKTEVEINAPVVDINAGSINNMEPGNVYIDGDEVHINDPDPAPEL
jgi:hypothetical protein